MDSDHVTMILNMNLNVLPQKPQKVEMLDSKNLNGKILFTKSTSETNEFTDCFNNVLPLLEQCEKWYKTLQSYCSKSYPIIRIKKNNSKTSYADKLIEKRSHLKKKIDEGKSSDRDELNRIEEQIAEIIEEEETNKAKLFKEYCNESSSINIVEMWKLKQKVWPKRQETLTTGKLNNQGQMVTEAEELKNLYAKEFIERLRSRPSHPEFVKIKKLKDLIFNLKIEKAQNKKSNDWIMKDLNEVLKTIKKGKSKDPEGLSREIFHPLVIGTNLKESLLIMLNLLKHHGMIPTFMKKP